MTLAGHECNLAMPTQTVNVMTCRVTREQALNVTKKLGSTFLVWRQQPRGMILNWF